MISIYRWSEATKACTAIAQEAFTAEAASLRDSPDVIWIDLENPTDEEERLVYETFLPIHPLTLEDITKPKREGDSTPHLPKAEEFPQYLFVIATPLTESYQKTIRQQSADPAVDGERTTTQLSAVLTHTVLITHHYQPIAGVHELRSFLARHGAQAERGPDYLFHLILDAAVDEYALALDHLDDSLDAVEVDVFRHPRHRQLATLLRLKREVIGLRKALMYQREVVARLARGEFTLIDEREMVYYRNVYDHLVRFAELADGSREAVGDLMMAHQAATSNRLNESMRALTMVSTTILPMTLIAGLYGMNFDHQPEYHWSLGYLWALSLMALAGVGAFAFFRWKKWI